VQAWFKTQEALSGQEGASYEIFGKIFFSNKSNLVLERFPSRPFSLGTILKHDIPIWDEHDITALC
jgi:hypothetical protein